MLKIDGVEVTSIMPVQSSGASVKRLQIDGVTVYDFISAPTFTNPVDYPDVGQLVTYKFEITDMEANDPAGVTYQWYYGDSGDESVLLSGYTSASLVKSTGDVGTHKYWCKVSNSLYSVNTPTVTVTVISLYTNILTPGRSDTIVGYEKEIYGTLTPPSFGGDEITQFHVFLESFLQSTMFMIVSDSSVKGMTLKLSSATDPNKEYGYRYANGFFTILDAEADVPEIYEAVSKVEASGGSLGMTITLTR